MKVSRVIFIIGIVVVVVAVIFKLFKIAWPSNIYHPLTYLRLSWTLFLIAIGYNLLFEK